MSPSEDLSPTLARAVLPTYLHHVMDASETLADFALKRLAGNETARRELAAQIDAQRETCLTPVSIFKGKSATDADSNTGPFASSTPLSPGARAAKRAADDAKLADLERALRAANAEAGEIELRLRVAEDAAASLRGAPRELRAVTRLLSDVISDLEAFEDDDDDGGAFSPRAPRSAGSASSGRSGASASLSPGRQEAIATAAAILADAERVDPSVPLVTGARVTAVARAAADAADALLSRSQQCLEEEAKLRGLLERAREARRVNADPAKPARSPSFLREQEDMRKDRREERSPFGARSPVSPSSSSASDKVGPVWSPGGRFLGSAAAARQSDATLKAQARRASTRRSLKDARTQKRVQRNLDYHIARLEQETRRMSTEADVLEAHLKRVEANHRNAAGALDTLAWLLEHAEAFRKEAARREAERRRRRERRFAPSGASVRQPARVSVSAGSDAFSETSFSSRGALGLPMRSSDADSRPASSRPASRASAIERWQARARAEESSARATPYARDSAGEEHWRDKYARQRDEIVSRESARSATRSAAEDETEKANSRDARNSATDATSGGRLPPSPPVEVDRVSVSSRDRNPERVSPLRRRHDRLMARKKEAEKTTSAARDVGDDESERPDGSPDGSPDESHTEETRLEDFGGTDHDGEFGGTRELEPEPEPVATIPMMRLEDLDLPVAVPVPMATPPVNRVLDMEAPRDVNELDDSIGAPPPRPETSLELIEAELAELRRLEFEATGRIPREFETLSSATSLDSARDSQSDARLDPRRTISLPTEEAEKKKNKKTLPVVDLRPKPKPKPREPWGPPPAPPKTKWKRNSLDREAVAALRKSQEKARASSPEPGGALPDASASIDADKSRAASSPRSPRASPHGEKKKKKEAFAPKEAKSPRRRGDDVSPDPAPAAPAEKKRSVFKSAYKSLKRAAGIPSKKDKAAAKAKQREKEREKAAAGPGGR